MPGGDYRTRCAIAPVGPSRPGPLLDADGSVRSASIAGRPRTRSASARDSASRWASRATSRASIHSRTRSSSVAARTSRPGVRRSSASRSWRRSRPPIHRASGPDPPSGGSAPAVIALGDAAREAVRTPTCRSGPRRPVRPAVLYDGDEVLGGGRSRYGIASDAAERARRDDRALARPVGAGRHLPPRSTC